jgi:hypothetical protein
MILDLVMASMYVALPVLWTAIVGWTGHQIGSVLRSSEGMAARVERAGGAVSGMTQRFLRIGK